MVDFSFETPPGLFVESVAARRVIRELPLRARIAHVGREAGRGQRDRGPGAPAHARGTNLSDKEERF